MHRLSQSPTDPAFVQNPYPFYHRARATGPLFYWEDYGMTAAVSHAAVQAILRDRRFGRAVPAELAEPVPDHLAPFYAIDDHSMLELEPPAHTRLRNLVLRAFTSRRIAALGPEIEALATRLAQALPEGDTDLLPAFATPLPVIVIARLLGVPEDMAPDLLRWSNTMVAMYQARRNRQIEDAAARAATEFSDYLRSYIDSRRRRPANDLITELIAAEEDGERLSTDEMIATCVLLLNAGHEATVHTIGNGVAALLSSGLDPLDATAPDAIDTTVEEILRYDPPLHMFTRWAYEEVQLDGHTFRRGDQVALLLGAANRDPEVWADPDRFDPTRPARPNASFGGGLHFCIGAPLARLELRMALPALFRSCPTLRLTETPRYADSYHFHGLERLMLRR
ncbi:cytochrome P450 [Pseudooceanicola sp. C21-150M6]|uniref:cytochrome P450 n=1 Tax=Pseudooceanicola sp. C21-150M6 TaxID=3434355 RepID=UPI003D7F322F